MKITKLMLYLTFIIWLPAHASTTREACLEDFRKIIIQSMKKNIFAQSGYGKSITMDVDDYSDGVYDFRLTVPRNPSIDNPDTSTTVGWVKLDVNTMKAYDESLDSDQPTELLINPSELNSIISTCHLQ